MNIEYTPGRKAVTILPPQIDEATGEPIEGTEQVVDTRIANWDVDPDEVTFEDVDDESLAPEDRAESIEVAMADVSDEIHSETVELNPNLAAQIAGIDMGDSPASITVQYLANQVYEGNITSSEAFNDALQSGISPEALVKAYRQLKSHFN